MNMGECQGKAPEPAPVVEPEPDPEPEQPKNSGGTILLVLAVVAGIPVVAEYAATGLVPRIPTMLGSLALAGCGALSFVTGLILDTVAKSHRRQWEIDVYKAMNGFYRE